MSVLWYPTVKECPVKGLAGMGGGIFWSSMGGGSAPASVTVVASVKNNTSPSPAGTYTDGQSFYLRGYDTGLNVKNPAGISYRNSRYMQVGADSVILARVWGSAGGSGNSNFGGKGGGGQFAEATITFDSDGGTIWYMVGAGGGWGDGTQIGSGGWGGGGSCGKEQGTALPGNSGTAFAAGGDASGFPVNRSAQGGGGGGCTGLFVKAGGSGQTADGNDASLANELLLAGAGGGYGGYSPGHIGAGGGQSHPNSATATAGGVNNTSDATNGGAGFGGAGVQRGGGGGSGLWGGSGGNDGAYGGQPGSRQGGGGGYGNTSPGTSVSGVTVTSATLSAATQSVVANNGGTGYISSPISYGTCSSQATVMGGSGLIQITVSDP